MSEAARWIPVEERLPEDMQEVYVYGSFGNSSHPLYEVALYTVDDGWLGASEADEYWNITHWRVVPQPPEATS
jgi:hypothetical protein